MHLVVSHTTRFDYDQPVQLQAHLLYLRPRDNPLLRVSAFELSLHPFGKIFWTRDDLDNWMGSVRFSTLSAVLEIRTSFSAATMAVNPFDLPVREYARMFPFDYEPLHRFNLTSFLHQEDDSGASMLREWVRERLERQALHSVGWLYSLNQAIFEHIAYRYRAAPGIQTAQQTLQLRTASCRDLATLFIACARAFGLAARFVSGYLLDPSRPSKTGNMHAWAEVFLPGAGWLGLDPTHGMFCDESYVPVAHAAVAPSVNPVQGAFFSEMPALARLTTDVRVTRVFGSQ